MDEEFRKKIIAFAQHAVDLADRCPNEESTKQFLVLPFLAQLGYDDRNPDEVRPEHGADFSEKYKNRVDYAIMRNKEPVVAVECKSVGAILKDDRGQLRAYFNAVPTVKMGVLTDGLIYEFYADSDEPNMMDQSAFLSVDLRDTADGKVESSIFDGLEGLQKTQFDPENIGAEAKRKLIFQNIVSQIDGLAKSPSESFTRLILQSAGIKHVRTSALVDYQEMIRSAFNEFIQLRILDRLHLAPKEESENLDKPKPENPMSPTIINDGIITTKTELNIFTFIRRRLAFLIKDENLFQEIERIEYHDFKGKFVVYYNKERRGRLFDFIEGNKGEYIFEFAEDLGKIVTRKLSDIDDLLIKIFMKRMTDFKKI